MQVEYDRDACAGWFQCVQKWDVFSMDMLSGKADMEGATEDSDNIFVRDVPEEAEEEALAAAESCPVDAIKLINDDGEQIHP